MLEENKLAQEVLEKKEEVAEESSNEQKNMKKNKLQPYVPKLLFLPTIPNDKVDKSLLTFIKNLKKLHINFPFIETLRQMAKHWKVLKELLSNKKKLEDWMRSEVP